MWKAVDRLGIKGVLRLNQVAVLGVLSMKMIMQIILNLLQLKRFNHSPTCEVFNQR
jgi:hypothetical protein